MEERPLHTRKVAGSIPSTPTKRRGLRQERIAAGQCPNCGKEAAPYYLCADCRLLNSLTRVLRKGERAGAFRVAKDGRSKRWFPGDPAAMDRLVAGSRPFPGAEDGRRAPRLRGRRIDIEGTLLQVIQRIGRPCTIEEILAAWGKLRDRRTTPLAADLACIVAAQDKRRRKAEKRVAIARRRASEIAP